MECKQTSLRDPHEPELATSFSAWLNDNAFIAETRKCWTQLVKHSCPLPSVINTEHEARLNREWNQRSHILRKHNSAKSVSMHDALLQMLDRRGGLAQDDSGERVEVEEDAVAS